MEQYSTIFVFYIFLLKIFIIYVWVYAVYMYKGDQNISGPLDLELEDCEPSSMIAEPWSSGKPLNYLFNTKYFLF